MKKILLGIVMLVALTATTTSCGGGAEKTVDNDTIVSRETCDSLSVALGKFMGINLQDEVRYLPIVDEYIEGYQLIAGHKYSLAQLMGIRAALRMAEQFINMEAEGVNVDRNLFMQQFRKYIQDFDLDRAEYALVYKEVQDFYQAIDNILMKREQMRNADRNAAAAVEEVTEIAIEGDSLDVADIDIADIEVAVDSQTNSAIGDEADMQNF